MYKVTWKEDGNVYVFRTDSLERAEEFRKELLARSCDVIAVSCVEREFAR
jgi:hypothetical protein